MNAVGPKPVVLAETVYVYILEYARPDRKGRRFYVGHTSDVLRRLLAHYLGYGSPHTRRLGVKRLVAVRAFASRAVAKAHEHLLRRMLTAGATPMEPCYSCILPRSLFAIRHRVSRLRQRR